MSPDDKHKPLDADDPLNIATTAVHDLIAARAKRDAAHEGVLAAKKLFDAAEDEVQTVEERVREILDLPFNEDR